MTTKILVVIAFFSISKLSAQEVFIQTGKNTTAYDFKTSDGGAAPDYRSGSGDFFEIGYKSNYKDTNFAYLISLTYNQFNAAASSGAINYSWNTSYLGIQNMIAYTLFKSEKRIEFVLKAGFNTAHIIKGEQFINTTYFDIKKQREFSGIMLQPIIGLNAKYSISENLSVSLGYNFSKTFNFSNSSNEKLSFHTNQIQFGLYFPIN